MTNGLVRGVALKRRSWGGWFLLLTAWAGALSGAAVMANQEDVAIDKIAWAELDFPPFQILGGEFAGTGSFDGLSELLIRRLAGISHEVVPMSFSRREEQLRQGRQMCTPGIFRTLARERYLVFSMPALIHLDNRLVFLASRADRFPSGATIDLEELFKRSDLIGSVISERSFAPNIDALLKRQGGKPNLVMRPIRSLQMLELLLNGDIDYTILFPHEAAYLERQLGRQGQLASRPITGTPPYIMTHVACTRGPWGEQAVERINGVLKGSLATPEYRRFSERWYADSDKALIRQYYPQLLEAAHRAASR
jgi:uncharacterized protein (TIGR02285 family)